MKRILLLLVGICLVSCGKSKEEQMLYDYQKKGAKAINFDIEDLDLQIKEIKKEKEITAKDSLEIYRNKLIVLWTGDDATQGEKDTLNFENVLSELDYLQSQYQKIIIANIKADRKYENYEYESKQDDVFEAMGQVNEWKKKADAYSKNPDSVLSVVYRANYTIKNPLLSDTKQTFDKYFYSDADNTKLVEEEMVSDVDEG